MQHNRQTSEPPFEHTVPAGYLPLLSTATYFEMDLVGKNLHMNGIDAVWYYPDLNEQPTERPSLFVRSEHKDHACAVIDSLDLTDFITYHGK
ncbi:MAG: hypothetical protein WCX28_10315 [Bacteriovoracaceae bacterium]|nr:hypothetical protein [Bacteroidota bacterium]